MSALVQNPAVVCTELEDGAVLLNMDSRLYYSLNNSALDIWRVLGAPTEPNDIVRRLTAHLDADDGTADTVAAFVKDLEQERLVVTADAQEDGSGTAATPVAGAEPGSFVAPELIRHDEPLHEVQISPFDAQLPLAE